MKRYAIAVVLLAALGRTAGAQPPVLVETPPRPVVTPPVIIQIPASKPPVGFYKSGHVLVGADGYYPFDSGDYLLGGTDGLARFRGHFVMVPAAAPVVVETGYWGHTGFGLKHRLFHRR
jgi:hypothetical protein